MPLLQVRDFPVELYDAISRAARAENRSIPQQTIVLLKSALDHTSERKVRRQAVFEEIDALKLNNTDEFPDPELLIREDREK